MTPLKIASLLPGATETLFALGLGDCVVAISHECDWPPLIKGLPRATRTRLTATATAAIDSEVQQRLAAGAPLYEVDGELLASLAPDLIVTQAQCDVCAVRYEEVRSLVDQYPALSDTQILALNPRTLADVWDDVQRLADAAGAVARGRAYSAELRQRVAAIGDQTARLAPADRVRIALLEWTDPLMLAGNWGPELVTLAGGVQPFAQPGEPSGYHAWEEILEFDPQLLIVMPCGFDLARSQQELPALAARPHFSSLSAVRNGRVFAVDANALFNRAGPRMVDSLELLAVLAQPHLFAEPAGRGVIWQDCS